MAFKVFYRSEREEPTVEMESNAGTPHNDRQRYNNLILFQIATLAALMST